jgi:hypothetical protein
MIATATQTLPDCQHPVIKECLNQFAHVFSAAGDDYGFCNLTEHTIELQPGSTVRPIHRRVPQKLVPEVQKQIAEMVEKGIIQKSKGPYSSPVLLTRKSDGTYRFCVDFKQLNSVTIKDAMPMPLAEEIFEQLHGARVISLIDLRSGYWQLPMAEKDRAKTAFCVNGE